jgi:hypothetical protein
LGRVISTTLRHRLRVPVPVPVDYEYFNTGTDNCTVASELFRSNRRSWIRAPKRRVGPTPSNGIFSAWHHEHTGLSNFGVACLALAPRSPKPGFSENRHINSLNRYRQWRSFQDEFQPTTTAPFNTRVPEAILELLSVAGGRF